MAHGDERRLNWRMGVGACACWTTEQAEREKRCGTAFAQCGQNTGEAGACALRVLEDPQGLMGCALLRDQL